MNKIVVVHHNDLDGICSAYLIHQKLQYSRKYALVDFYKVDYSDSFDIFSKIDENTEEVYIVDFSFDRKIMIDLRKRFNNKLIWIDHHSSAIEKLEDIHFEGIQSIHDAACILTWEYFYQDHPAPVFVRLLADYDTWSFQHAESKEFQYGMCAIPHEVSDEIWNKVNSNYCAHQIDKMAELGSRILCYQSFLNKKLSELIFKVYWAGFRCAAVNTSLREIGIFDQVEDCEIYIFYYLDKNQKWSFHLRSSVVDVSKIAQGYGGGGHKGAAGFMSDSNILLNRNSGYKLKETD